MTVCIAGSLIKKIISFLFEHPPYTIVHKMFIISSFYRDKQPWGTMSHIVLSWIISISTILNNFPIILRSSRLKLTCPKNTQPKRTPQLGRNTPLQPTRP